MDWCDHPADYSAPELYTKMSKALNNTGRPMFFSICEWGLYDPWTWAPAIANSWRVGPDHLPLWWTPPTEQDPGQVNITQKSLDSNVSL
jgi:alpha-galactosidase